MGMSRTDMLQACVLSGTDYCAGVPNIALTKACTLLRKHGNLPAVFIHLGLSDELKCSLTRAYCTFLFHIVRTPVTMSVSSVQYLTINDATANLNLVDPEEYLGVQPSSDIAQWIATGKCNPEPPYDVNVEVSAPARPEATPLTPEQILAQFGLSSPVPRDRVLTESKLHEILKLRIQDIPGADVFARDQKDELVTPEEQLRMFQARTIDPVMDQLKQYARCRGIDLQLNKPELIPAVIICMEREAELKCFQLVDPEDGKYEKARRFKLSHAGILTFTNAPGYVPVEIPPLNDSIWEFASADDLTGIPVLQELYKQSRQLLSL